MIDKKEKLSEMIFWAIGALERLATLGMLDPEIPYKIPFNKVDRWVELDEGREALFEGNVPLVKAVAIGIIANPENEGTDPEEIIPVAELVAMFYDRKGRNELVNAHISEVLGGG
ncbi:hypothetical protein SCBWM1_gp48 [Synechococcus phage S-CBWM1]|uniref:Uncharacterized protein n=1 Tax=Synechococcus phage S-CBWM1 TaxID=2053653 RepID=A0A3G1L3G8_9CAUD|nr:hypothetical protein HOU61_gp149 [Synechococcus phage S-CBWM1]ATW62732.1 hypothetical protein SCBWM1_gp48 [Synechococcus phage S-CBWM1]